MGVVVTLAQCGLVASIVHRMRFHFRGSGRPRVHSQLVVGIDPTGEHLIGEKSATMGVPGGLVVLWLSFTADHFDLGPLRLDAHEPVHSPSLLAAMRFSFPA